MNTLMKALMMIVNQDEDFEEETEDDKNFIDDRFIR